MPGILGNFGPDSNQPQPAGASNGGALRSKDVMNYKPPYGPRGIMDGNSVGLHGSNSGNANKPTQVTESSTPIAGAINRGNCGSQGCY
jgi:hypothetical protein